MPDIQIHELTPADPLAGAEMMPISQGGLTRRATLNQLAELAPRGPAGPQGPPGPGLPTGGSTNQVLAKASNADGETKWDMPGMMWRGQWSAGQYDYQNVVRSGPWTSVVINPMGTTAPPEPQPATTAWFLPESPTWESVSASFQTLRTAVRISVPGWITSVRSWDPLEANVVYDVGVRFAPGTAWEREVWLIEGQPSDPSYDGWNPIPLPEPLFVQPGVIVDVVRVARNLSNVSDNLTMYQYIKPGNTLAPNSGQVVQSGKDPGLLRVSKTGADSVDNSAMLMTVRQDCEISVSDQRWVVQSAADMGTWVDFRVTPAVQSSLVGYEAFTFSVFSPAVAAYRRIADYFAGNPGVQGLVRIDEGSVGLTEDAYGIDAEFEPMNLSTDWEIMSYSPVY